MFKPYLTFGGGGGGSSQKVIADTIKSSDTVELVLALGEGPWWGPVQGAHSLYFDQTPIAGADGKSNFYNVGLIYYPGSALGEEIKPQLGGFSSPIPDVNASLSQGVPVVRAGSQTAIDFVEMRFIVAALYATSKDGQRATVADIKIEFRADDETDWSEAWVYIEPSPVDPTGPAGSYASYAVFDPSDVTEAVGTVTYVATSAPGEPENPRAIWLNSSNNYQPYIWSSGAWTSDASFLSSKWTYLDTVGNTGNVYIDNPYIEPLLGDIRVDDDTVTSFNGAAWVFSTHVAGPQPGILRLNDKVTSQAVREVRFSVPNVEKTYEYRVTIQTADTGDDRVQEIGIESIQEVKARSYTFPGVTCLKVVAQASDQFSSLPTMQGIYKMRLIKVPTNFNPVTRAYDGVWDGTYKIAWTDSLPWCFMDYVENTTFGLSQLFPHTCNKWRIYEWAQWCDTMVSDGRGGMRARWTWNHIQLDAIDAKEMATQMASAGGGRYVDDGNGLVDVLFETDSDAPVVLFTNENVIDGLFRYSYTDRQTRSNQVWVSFKNPDLFYRGDRRPIKDQGDIDVYGVIPEEFNAVGCRNLPEALARGRMRLVGAQREKCFVNFTTHRKGYYLRPWQVILVADADAGHGISGVVTQITGARTLTIREAITLEPGETYKLQFDTTNPDYPSSSTEPYMMHERTIVTDAGTVTELEVDEDLPDLPEFCTFALSSADTIGLPKAYRVLAIDLDADDPDKVQIQALEIYREKWLYIDGEVDELPEDDTTNYYNGVIEAIPSINFAISDAVLGFATRRSAQLFWEPSPTKWIKRYRVLDSINGGSANEIGTTSDSTFQINDLPIGLHTYTVIPVDIFGKEGPPKSYRIDITGELRSVKKLTNLRLSGGGSTFTDKTAAFLWDDDEPDASFSHYRVRVLNSSNLELRSEDTQAREWVYDFDKQRADSLHRSIKIGVSSVDQVGNISEELILSVSNPVPAAPSSVVYVATLTGAIVRAVRPSDPDIVGMRVWARSTGGYNPASVDPDFIVDQDQVEIPISTGASKYVRVAFYDRYGSTGLNVSSEQQVTPSLLAPEQMSEDFTDAIQTQIDDTIDPLSAALDELEAATLAESSKETMPGFWIVGGHGSISLEANAGSVASAIKVNAGYFDHPALDTHRVEVAETTIRTPWSGPSGSVLAPENGWFAIIWSEEAVSTRFSNGAGSGHIFPATRNTTTGVWTAWKQDIHTGQTFTPRTTDVVIGRADKPLVPGSTTLSSSDGVTNAESFIRETNVVNSRLTTFEASLGAPGDTPNASGSAYARYANLVIVQALDNAARAAETSALTASLATANAAITTQATALATETSARTSADTTLTASIATNTAAIATNATAIATETSARSSADTTLTANVATNTAAIATNATAIATETSARTSADSTLTANVATNTAAISTNATAIANETSARTSADSTLTANVATNTAAISTNATAIANETSARTSADSTLTANVATNTANIATNATAIATETAARSSADSTLTANVATNTAAISTNATAIAAETSARTSADSTLTATTASHTASLATQATAIATANSAMVSWTQILAATGSDPAIMAMTAGYGGSQIGFTAKKVMVLNSAGNGVVGGMILEGGNAKFTGNLDVGGAIRVGAASVPVALEPKQFTVADGGSFNFYSGAALSAIPKYTIQLPGGVPLSSGEAFGGPSLVSISTTGATLRMRINTPGSTSSVTSTTTTTGGGGAPARLVDKTDSADAYNGVYNFRVQGTITVTSDYEAGLWFMYGSAYITTWFYHGGAWHQGPDIEVTLSDASIPETSATNYAGSRSFDVTYPISYGTAIGGGSGGTYEFGATHVGGGSLTGFPSVQWTKQSASGDRTGSPNGETAIVTIYPVNT